MFNLIKILCLIVVCPVIFISCSHTNQLSEYDISSKKILFVTNVIHQKSSTNIRYDDGRFGRDISIPERIVTKVGTEDLESDVEEKLDKVFDPENVVEKISSEIKDDLKMFIAVIPVDSLEQEPEIIGETNLHRFRLISGSDGVSASITAEFILTERGSGKIIWSNKRTVNTPLKESVTSYVFDSRVRKAGSVVNAIRLAEMTEEEIEEAIQVSASEFTYELLRTLRNDISKSAK